MNTDDKKLYTKQPTSTQEPLLHKDTDYPFDNGNLTPPSIVSDASVPYQTGTSPTTEATSADFWNLPDNVRAELIDGKLHYMESPTTAHQVILAELFFAIKSYIRQKGGSCLAIAAPYAVNLNADDKTWVEPDILVICDREKINRRGCDGAPDFIIEIASPGSRKLDYITKNNKYAEAGVREYWIVDVEKKCTTVYYFEKDSSPIIIPFDQSIPVSIFGDLRLCITDLVDPFLLNQF